MLDYTFLIRILHGMLDDRDKMIQVLEAKLKRASTIFEEDKPKPDYNKIYLSMHK